jgi:hypothetical protein
MFVLGVVFVTKLKWNSLSGTTYWIMQSSKLLLPRAKIVLTCFERRQKLRAFCLAFSDWVHITTSTHLQFCGETLSSRSPRPRHSSNNEPYALALSVAFRFPILFSLASLPLLLNFPPPANPRGLAGKPNWFNYIVLIRGSCLRIECNCTAECTVFSSPNGRLGKWREVEIYPCWLLQPQPLGSLKLNWLQGAVFTTLWSCRL